MATARQSEEPIVFRGGPYGLTAVVPELAGELAVAGVFACTLRGAAAKGDLSVSAIPDVDPRIVRLALPPRTGAGVYDGHMLIGKAPRAAVFHVEPQLDLRLLPERARFAATPGGEVLGRWHILNNGNAQVEIPKVVAFGLFLDGGLERALRQVYTAEPAAGQRRIDLLADVLADSHGGLVKGKVVEGAGPLASGELRPLAVQFHLERKMKAGHSYTGNLELPGLVYPITFDLRESASPSQPKDRVS